MESNDEFLGWKLELKARLPIHSFHEKCLFEIMKRYGSWLSGSFVVVQMLHFIQEVQCS